MSKKDRKQSLEIGQVGTTQELPNYVTPTTDLEYQAGQNEKASRSRDCEDCRRDNCRD